jgi:hypothetical protein
MDIRRNKERGEWAELRFMAKAAEHGFKFAKLWGDSAPYDMVLDLGGRFVRVQVKSTMCEASLGNRHVRPGSYAVFLRHQSTPRYRRTDFDYLAVYVIPKDIWYVMPSEAVVPKIGIRVCPGNRANLYECYREAWYLLQQPPGPPPVRRRGVYNIYGIIEEPVGKERGCWRLGKESKALSRGRAARKSRAKSQFLKGQWISNVCGMAEAIP